VSARGLQSTGDEDMPEILLKIRAEQLSGRLSPRSARLSASMAKNFGQLKKTSLMMKAAH
jgi:hypothetical protein